MLRVWCNRRTGKAMWTKPRTLPPRGAPDPRDALTVGLVAYLRDTVQREASAWHGPDPVLRAREKAEREAARQAAAKAARAAFAGEEEGAEEGEGGEGGGERVVGPAPVDVEQAEELELGRLSWLPTRMVLDALCGALLRPAGASAADAEIRHLACVEVANNEALNGSKGSSRAASRPGTSGGGGGSRPGTGDALARVAASLTGGAGGGGAGGGGSPPSTAGSGAGGSSRPGTASAAATAAAAAGPRAAVLSPAAFKHLKELVMEAVRQVRDTPTTL
jgi:hypothetical protein